MPVLGLAGRHWRKWKLVQVHGGDQSPLPPLWNSFVGTGIHNGPVPPANLMLKQEKREQPKEVLHLCRWSTHTHTRPKTKPNVTRSESTRKQRPTVSANPHLREEGRRMKRKRKWNNITHATHLKFKTSEVKFTVTAQRIQNTLNENRSQSGFRLAKIGTMFAIPLSTSDPSYWSRRCDMSCLSPYHDMKVQCVCNHGIRFPGRFSD